MYPNNEIEFKVNTKFIQVEFERQMSSKLQQVLDSEYFATPLGEKERLRESSFAVVHAGLNTLFATVLHLRSFIWHFFVAANSPIALRRKYYTVLALIVLLYKLSKLFCASSSVYMLSKILLCTICFHEVGWSELPPSLQVAEAMFSL